jgi:hypothetical protein
VYLRNPTFLLCAGMLCLVAAIALKRFGEESQTLAFIEGMLTGVATVFLVAFLIMARRSGKRR